MGLGTFLGKSLIGGVVGSVFGNRSARSGAKIDTREKLRQESELYSRAEERGLTPQEYYGSPAPGNPSSSGAGQVIGNQTSKMMSDAMSTQLQISENEKNRQNAKDIANIQAGTATRGQDITASVAREKIALEIRKHEEIGLKKSAADLRISAVDLKQRLNKLVTDSPGFLREMKRLGMGTENMYVETVLRDAGITDFAQIPAMSPSARQKLMARMLAGSSAIAKNMAALQDQGQAAGDSFVGDAIKVYDYLIDTLSGKMAPIEPARPQLGKGKGPYHPRFRGRQ